MLGRYCCQYEDVIEPYLHLSKHIYKDLLYVYKDSTIKKLQVGSTVLKVKFYGNQDKYLFPGKKKTCSKFFVSDCKSSFKNCCCVASLMGCLIIFKLVRLFFNWDSLHTRPNSH